MTLECLSIAEDGQTATGQFQILFGGWYGGITNRCAAVFVAFKQNGQDVQMRATATRSYGGNETSAAAASAKYGTDLTNQGSAFTLSTNGTDGNYGAGDPTLQFGSSYSVKLATMGYYQGIRAMAGATSVPGCKAQLVIKGTDNTKMRYAPPATHGHVMPETDGLMRVLNGGEFVQQKAHNSYDSLWVGDKGLIRVEKGGAFKQQADWGPGVAQRMEFIGGEFRAYDISSVSAGRLTANQMTFTDNAKFYSVQKRSDDYVRAGYSNDAVWTVRGTLPSTNDIDLIIWAYATGNTMTFAVGDVAEGSDFIMNGYIDVHTTYTNTTVYKTGSGTIQLNKYVNTRGRPLILTEGTWFVNGSSLTRVADPYTIDGGTLAVADGTTNSLGVLTVGENGGGINLGEGATLTFADSSAATWAGTNKVVVTGFAEKSIRFGTAKGGLADTQRRRLRTSDDKQLHIDSEGYLTRNIGLAIIIR